MSVMSTSGDLHVSVTEVMHRSMLLAKRYREEELGRLIAHRPRPKPTAAVDQDRCGWCGYRHCPHHNDLDGLWHGHVQGD